MPRIELILQHGWSYDAQVWLNVRQMLDVYLASIGGDSRQYKLQAPNRGYFGEPVTAGVGGFEPGAFNVVLTHSFGLHLIERQYLSAANMIIIVAGFLSIHDGASPARSRKTIARMRHGLEANPQAEIAGFHARCGVGKNVQTKVWDADYPTDVEALNSMNHTLLAADLELLDVSRFDPSAINPEARVSIVAGFADPIVPAAYVRSLNKAIAGSTLIELTDAGHSLPITHPQACLQPLFDQLDLRVGGNSKTIELVSP